MKLDRRVKEVLERQHKEDIKKLYALDDGDFEAKDIGRDIWKRVNGIRRLLGKDRLGFEELKERRMAGWESSVGRENPAHTQAQINKSPKGRRKNEKRKD
ncbi:hypothetical protein AKJ51_00760 [candidate division MSBL1 archaeon SCGC-AAA382A20]|uniref:Uncharacterized protein n=1 Tax=candidate division MSBL1 archaeon SCGC-AAA382A20 TaxID=1698280 RepID=A0A133VMF8_9EURY|nr:hypothetical protein AKJ51_00760 [candidate division MSBL1 archaeon SCGC-AAA382A20]